MMAMRLSRGIMQASPAKKPMEKFGLSKAV